MDLKDKTIAIIGLGGLGGYVSEFICRQNCNKIVLIDGDKFDISNIDRQLECKIKTLGKYKVECYKNRIENICDSEVLIYKEFLKESNLSLIKESDLVFDCLDNIEDRLVLEKYCEENGIPIVHGAIGDHFGNVCLCLPGSKMLEKIYKDKIDIKLKTNANVVSMISSTQVEIAMKYFSNNYEDIKNKLIYVDFDDFQIKKFCI